MNTVNSKLSLVIPVYNEAACLEANATKMLEYLKSTKMSYEVVLVNDGSTDSTEAVCQSIVNRNQNTRLISYSVNRGKGHAVKTGMLAATGVYRIYTDADLAVPIQYVWPCIRQLQNGTDMVIGSRNLAKSSIEVPEGFLRRFLGGAYLSFVRSIFNLRVSDVTCGLKGFQEKIAHNIFSRSKIERWGYDAEIIFLARKLEYSICEIPVKWYHSFDSKVKVGLDSVRTFSEMLQIYRNYRRGRYRL